MHRPLRNLIIASLAVVDVLIIAIPAWFTLAERAEHLRDARVHTATLARALEEHISRTLASAQLLLHDAADAISARGGLARVGPEAMHRLLAERAGRLPQAGAVYAFDENLRLFATSLEPHPPPIDGSRLEHVAVHQAPDADRLFLGKTARGVISGKYNIPLTYRVERADGRLDGVLGAAISFEYFGRTLLRVARAGSRRGARARASRWRDPVPFSAGPIHTRSEPGGRAAVSPRRARLAGRFGGIQIPG